MNLNDEEIHLYITISVHISKFAMRNSQFYRIARSSCVHYLTNFPHIELGGGTSAPRFEVPAAT
jgi:hypothetical protein